ncbi:glycoside hydrolase family 3 N-terminal domain-containing protein [Nonomuraea sp. B19D2]|uniref:glycoside hydrolase family 3 protein n=1 Tax=Nonomuraea sp. B19D2 TaxID=3159561 RepID=UPI0032DB0B51
MADLRDLNNRALTVLQPCFDGTTPPDWLRAMLDDGLSAITLYRRNISSEEQLAALTSELRRHQPELIIAVDEEGGDITRVEGQGSSFPGNAVLGAIDDVALTESVGEAIGSMLARCGVNLDLAPVVDLYNPTSSVIGTRSFGMDPDLVARHTASYVKGIQASCVAACAKHFPGHGQTAEDSHFTAPRAAEDAKLPPHLVSFQAAISAGVKAIMSAHLVLPRYGELPATLNRLVLDGLLRKDLRFDGVVITDGMEMESIVKPFGLEKGTVMALAAGADLICVGGGLPNKDTVVTLRAALVDAVVRGRLSEERLHDAARRVRALATWAHPVAASDVDLRVGLVAARLAITRQGIGSPLDQPPHVVEFSQDTIHGGRGMPWGLGCPAAKAFLDRLLPGTTWHSVRHDEPYLHDVLAAAEARPLILSVRNLHRHEWMRRMVRDILTTRPDAVLIEAGMPIGLPDTGAVIAAHSGSLASAIAVVEVLTERSWDDVHGHQAQ